MVMDVCIYQNSSYRDNCTYLYVAYVNNKVDYVSKVDYKLKKNHQ